jgi:hypothetical protein
MDIIVEIRSERKKTQSLTDHMVRAKTGQYTQLVGCFDATAAGIGLINPTQTELAHLNRQLLAL